MMSDKCQEAFKTIKITFTSDLLLTHFEPSLSIVLAVDVSNSRNVYISVSPDGSEKATSHATCILTKDKCNYSQIEKEVLALIFMVWKVSQDDIHSTFHVVDWSQITANCIWIEKKISQYILPIVYNF